MVWFGVGVGDELDEVNQEIAVMSEVRACAPLVGVTTCRLRPVPIVSSLFELCCSQVHLPQLIGPLLRPLHPAPAPPPFSPSYTHVLPPGLPLPSSYTSSCTRTCVHVQVQCTQLIKYHASYVVDAHLWIVMEYLEGGSVAEALKVRPRCVLN